MSYGFKFINNNGITVIDENYSNYQVIQEGTMSSQGTNGVATIPASWVLSDKLLMVRPPNNTVRFALANYRAADRTNWYLWGSENVIFQYKLVAPASALTAPTGYGIAVYKSNGALAFSYAKNSLKIDSCTTLLTGGASPFDIILPATANTKFINLFNHYAWYWSDTQMLEERVCQLVSETRLRIYRRLSESIYSYSVMAGHF